MLPLHYEDEVQYRLLYITTSRGSDGEMSHKCEELMM